MSHVHATPSIASMSTAATTVNTSAPHEALEFIDFLNASPSPFHAVHEAVQRLEKAGFQRLSERSDWTLKREGKYYFTRNGSSVVAFVVGGAYKPGNGFSIVGAHTDSPCLKLKPVSKKENAGYLEVGVQLYGGGIWHSWFDRDLGIAGRVMVQQEDGSFKHTLVRIHRPILRVPTLAIHLDGSANEAFKFNKETHLLPILATTVKSYAICTPKIAKVLNAPKPGHGEHADRHHPCLIEALANEIGVQPSSIHDFDLSLYDIQPATLGGLYNEFIFSARLDNLGMSYCSLMALIRSSNDLSQEPNVRLVSLFDNEEVGSTTLNGANSNLLPATLERIVATDIGTRKGKSSKSTFEQAVQKSLLVSADMAHAVHPNYTEKYEENHRPAMHKGTVIKINANQKYATTAPTSLIIREIARRRNIPIQEFVVRNDSSCGSTIGPMLSAKLGLRTIDVGNPQLSMHSIRETGGVDDVKNGISLLEAFFELFPSVDEQVVVD
ncbi:peptidase M18 [Radiomyces spectabilis]|uniref:peptidase M18 n=1 Tax=Radiomyces spectabilis TaxID=64574 RepID=UPI00221E4FF9|nr:peptidase M18 [Radiomyces spectabilis]KAI8372834.1 peptidase M18 [Radiomyces spectabilis]